MKAYQRILSLLLCGLLLMASCGTADTNNPSTETIGGENDAAAKNETLPAETEISDDLPEKDLGGWDMDIVCHEDALSGTWTFTAEELNGELINDEIYNRTVRLEDRFNFNYNVVPPEGSDVWGRMGTVLKNLVAAGDDVYDLAIYYTYQLQAQMVQGKLFYNMLKIPYIDFDKPWWHTEINDTFTLYGYLPTILSDYSLNSYQYANLLVYNTTMANDRGIDGLYDMVRDGTWTLDSFQKIVESVTTDTNGDGKFDENDTYGYATNFGYHALTWCYAIGEMGIHLKEDGVELGYQSEKFSTMTEWLYNMLYGANNTFEIGWDKECAIKWDENRVFIQAIWFNDLEKFRQNESGYGLLPYPKYSEQQEKYYTYDDCRCGAFGVPIVSAAENRENTGLILEALSADSYKHLIPAYLENMVTFKLSRDEDSLEMLDYIMEGRVYDIGYSYPDPNNYTWVIYYKLKGSDGKLASTLAGYAESTKKYYNDKILTAYQELGEMEW